MKFSSKKALEIHITGMVLDMLFSAKSCSGKASLHSLTTLFQSFSRLVNRIDDLLARPTLRTHQNGKPRHSEVNEKSSKRRIMRRLNMLVKTACQLADLADKGPAANDDEQTALDTVESELKQLQRELIPSDVKLDRSFDVLRYIDSCC